MNEIIKINLSGTFYCIQAVAKPMMEQKSGSIINVTSAAGIGDYRSGKTIRQLKGGVYAWSKSAAKELARYDQG